MSRRHIPAVKRTGKHNMIQMLVPFVASIEDIPKSATSDEVSNPSPKSTPNGYIFQGRSISLNMPLKIENKQPPPSNEKASNSESGALDRILRSCWTSLKRIYMLTRPRTRRNAAETEVPMIPPVELNWSNLLLIAPAVAATTMLVMTTILF